MENSCGIQTQQLLEHSLPDPNSTDKQQQVPRPRDAVLGPDHKASDDTAAASNSAKRRKKLVQHVAADLQDVQNPVAPPFLAAKGLLAPAPAKATAPATARTRKVNKQPVSPV